jgi:hypothetical protein
MAYVIIVEFRAKPDPVAAFVELIGPTPTTRERSRTAAALSTSATIPTTLRASSSTRPTATRRRISQHLEMGSFKWFRAMAPDLVVPG